MATIRFPWRVKVGNDYFKPGELISVNDPEKYVSEGAEIVDASVSAEPVEAEQRPRRGRRKKES